MIRILHIITFLILSSITLLGQTGLTVGPPRVYFVGGTPGSNMSQYVDVTNPSKDYPLELAISYEDWKYSELGDNQLFPSGTLENSLANWITVSEPYFSLAPGETKRIQLNITIPSDLASSNIPVYTSMLFVTQMNPRANVQQEGANIRLAVRSGIKIYYRQPQSERVEVDIENMIYHKNDSMGSFLELVYSVDGNSWTEGTIRIEYLNQETGKQTRVPDLNFYALPGDKRRFYSFLPQDLSKGKYVATLLLFYGEGPEIKIGEIAFNYE